MSGDDLRYLATVRFSSYAHVRLGVAYRPREAADPVGFKRKVVLPPTKEENMMGQDRLLLKRAGNPGQSFSWDNGSHEHIEASKR